MKKFKLRNYNLRKKGWLSIKIKKNFFLLLEKNKRLYKPMALITQLKPHNEQRAKQNTWNTHREKQPEYY
jgi:hypothetical protein